MISFLLYTLLAVFIQGLFAFFEMACVSFNRMRLQYYVSIGTRRALWLHYLLKTPSRLFGTTLIGINTALVVGSECARRFYESIHIDPDWAPLTQVIIVVIFGELAPMFAARRHSEQAAMFCVPLMVLLAKVLSPIIWCFDHISHLIHRSLGKAQEVPLFLSREEVKLAFEDREGGEDEFDAAVSNIFQMKSLTAGELMTPIGQVQMIPSQASVAEMRHLLSIQYSPVIPVYHRSTQNIVAIAHLRDFLRVEEGKRVLDHARSPWFVTQDTSVVQLLQQFKRNNQSVATILDGSGQACGILTLDQILEEIFGEESSISPLIEEPAHYVLRTFSGDISIEELKLQLQSDFPTSEGSTLSDLIHAKLDHPPVKGETIRLGDFEFTVEEITLRGVKTVSVRSVQE